MTNPVNIVPKNDNDGSKFGKNSKRWSEAHIVNIKSQVIQLVSKITNPDDTSNSLYVKNGQLFFGNTAISGLSEEYITQLIEQAIETLNYIDTQEATTIAATVANTLIQQALSELSIPNSIGELQDVDLTGNAPGYVLKFDGVNFVPTPDNAIVSSVLNLSDASNVNKPVTVGSSQVLKITGTPDLTVTANDSGNGTTFSLGLSPSISSNSATASAATKLATAKDITISGDVTPISMPFDGSANINIPVNVLRATQLRNPINVTLNGDVVSSPVSFNGSSNLSIQTTVKNSEQATKLSNVRNISIQGDATGSATFDGSANCNISTTVGVASKLRTARKISITGDVSGNVLFDGSSNVSIPTIVNNSATADHLTNNISIQLAGPISSSAVSTNFSSGFNIPTKITKGTIKQYRTFKINSLVFKDGTGGPNPPDGAFNASTTTSFINNLELMNEPLFMFKLDESVYIEDIQIHLQGGGRPETYRNTNTKEFKIIKDYVFALYLYQYDTTTKTFGAPSGVTTFYIDRKPLGLNPFSGPWQNVITYEDPERIIPRGTPIPAGYWIGMSYAFIQVASIPPGYELEEPGLATAYGATITITTSNVELS